jgi:tRNA(adenine34) deaminase
MALAEAECAAQAEEVPVGAVVVKDGRVLGRGHNRTRLDEDPTAHAEMVAIRAAANALGSWRLEGCSLYVTLEPCAMCAGAIVLARLDRLVFGAADPKAGACGSLRNVVEDPRLNHRIKVGRGVLERECGEVLKAFFRARRGATQAEAASRHRT